MAKVKVFPIMWTESAGSICGESVHGNILICKKTGVATLFGVCGTRVFQPDYKEKLSKRLLSMKSKLEDMHQARMKYVVGGWLKEWKE